MFALQSEFRSPKQLKESIADLPRRSLQAIAKEIGVKANQTSAIIRKDVYDHILGSIRGQENHAPGDENISGPPNTTSDWIASEGSPVGSTHGSPLSTEWHEQQLAEALRLAQAPIDEPLPAQLLPLSPFMREVSRSPSLGAPAASSRAPATPAQHPPAPDLALNVTSPPSTPVTPTLAPMPVKTTATELQLSPLRSPGAAQMLLQSPLNGGPKNRLSAMRDELRASAHLGECVERAKKSGVWQGRRSIQLDQMQARWLDYKHQSVRDWRAPTAEELSSTQNVLRESGFTTVSPLERVGASPAAAPSQAGDRTREYAPPPPKARVGANRAPGRAYVSPYAQAPTRSKTRRR